MTEIKVTVEAPELCAAIFALADAIDGRGIVPKLQEAAAAEKTPVKEPAAGETPAAVTTAQPQAPVYTLEKTREALADVPKAKLQALMRDFHVTKLTELDPAFYPELLAKAK